MKKVFFAGIAIGLGLFFVFGLLEVGLRIVGPSWLKERMQEVGVKNTTGAHNNAVFGSDAGWPIERKEGEFYRFTPGSSFSIDHYEYKNEARIDQWGGRVSGLISLQDAVPVLGDSFTFGVGVDDDQNFVSLLNKNKGNHFLNLGVPGSCLTNHLDMIKFRHQELGSPDQYVFVFFLGNDLANIYVEHTQKKDGGSNDLRPLSQSASTRILQTVNDGVRTNALLRRIYVIQFLKSKLLVAYNRYRESKGIISRMDDEYFHVIRATKHFSAMVSALEKELMRLEKLQQELNFRASFILIPDRHQVVEKMRNEKLEYYGLAQSVVNPDLLNKVLKERLKKIDVKTLDVTDCMRTYQNEDLYYKLDNHLTARGHQVAAACIEEML